MHVSQALRERRSVRAFTSQVPSAQLVQQLMQDAALAASGGNMQPWRVAAITGERLSLTCHSKKSGALRRGRIIDGDTVAAWRAVILDRVVGLVEVKYRERSQAVHRIWVLQVRARRPRSEGRSGRGWARADAAE